MEQMVEKEMPIHLSGTFHAYAKLSANTLDNQLAKAAERYNTIYETT